MAQKNYISHYEHLKNKWTDRHKQLEKTLWEKHKDAFEWLRNNSKQFAAGSIGGLIMLTTSLTNPVQAHAAITHTTFVKDIDKSLFLISDLSVTLPENVQPLTTSQEIVAAQILTRHFGFRVVPELQEKRLNTTYGFIGAEQHLARYPGDTMSNHFDNLQDQEIFTSSGMAPGRGAWGYFAESQSQLTEKDTQREKYYVAVQTFLSPGYNERIKEYSDFFRYRKLLVVNPSNGKAIVADIADAGPSPWTGKQLGGSPEVMHYLERVDGSQKGPVLYFFIDDPNDQVSLGPVTVK